MTHRIFLPSQEDIIFYVRLRVLLPLSGPEFSKYLMKVGFSGLLLIDYRILQFSSANCHFCLLFYGALSFTFVDNKISFIIINHLNTIWSIFTITEFQPYHTVRQKLQIIILKIKLYHKTQNHIVMLEIRDIYVSAKIIFCSRFYGPR